MSLLDRLRLWGTRGDANPQRPLEGEDQDQDHVDQDDFRDQGQQHPNIGVDEQIWTQYLARIKPDITPDDPAFQSQLETFHNALQQDSIESILQTYFAEYDVWRFIQGHVSRKKYPHVRAQQDRDTAAWKQLMAGPPWSEAPARASLAFKCTMMYFGLPVQPMQFRDSLADSRSGLLGGSRPEGLFGDDEQEDGWDGEEITYFVPEDMRPLRFLNYFHKLGYGKDNSHMNPDKSFELFYTIPMPMNLRGGQAPGTDEQDSVMSSSNGNDDDDLSIRGGEGAQGNLDLWGLSGRTIANFSNGLGSFFSAVDRLLGLRSRNNAGITVSILGHPQHQRTPCKVLWEGQCPLGNQRRETEFLTKMGHALREVMDNIYNDNTEWKICVSQISQDKHLADSDALSYQPCLETHHLASFSLDGNQGALAYLFIPSNVDAGTAANHYQNWFRSLWRTLSSPDLDAEKSYALGSSAVQPSSSCLLRITDGGGESTEYFLSDMGPPRQIWEWLVEAHHSRGQREFVLDALPIPVPGSLVHIPGYFRGLSEHIAYDNIQDVIQVAMEAIPDERDKMSLQHLLIRPIKSGGGGFLDVEGVHVLCQDGIIIDPESPDDDDDEDSSSKKLAMWLQNGYPLHMQPRWAEYEAMMLNSDGTSLGDMTLTLDSSEPWSRILAQIRTAYTNLALPCIEDTIIRMDQRVVPGDHQDKNRTRWDIPAVDTPEATESWKDFVLGSLTTKCMTLQLCYSTTAPGQELSNAVPFALRDQQPEKFYWGCHDRADDVVALYEEEAEMEVEQEDDGGRPEVPSHSRTRVHRRDHRHRTQASSNQGRTVGYEDPGLQATGTNNLSVNPQGIPMRNEGLDDFQRGVIFREWSYGHPLSIHMEGQYPEIPVNAPPLEQLLKVPGPDGGVSDSVPVLSTQLMTATEQRRLQEAFFKMRSLALGRVQECPFAGCWKYFGLDLAGTQSFQKHLKDVHVGKQCPFCHDTLLDSWALWQVAQHFLTKHVDQFSHKGDLRRDLTVPILSKGLVHRREEQFKFCPRCGRNHAILDAKPDRAQHDNLCYPGNCSTTTTTKYCVSCGEGYVPAKGLFPHQAHEKECKATPEQKGEAVYCHDCALPTHAFSRRYAHKHTLFCKGAGSKRVVCCPWCGVDLKLVSEVECHTHLDSCAQKPHGGQNPIDTGTGEPLDSPRDTADLRRRAQHYKPMSQYFVRIEVPKMCPVEACGADLTLFNAGGLFKHFYDEHKASTGKMTTCPICRMDFQARGWALLDQKTQHLDDHIARREQRILGDLQAAQATSRGDPALKEGLDKHDGDNIDAVQQLVATEVELARMQDAFIDMEREKLKLQKTLASIPNLPSTPIPPPHPFMGLVGRHHEVLAEQMRRRTPKPSTPTATSTSGVAQYDGGSVEAGPSHFGPQQHQHLAASVAEQAQQAPGSSGGNRSRRPARDGTYRPDRGRRSDGDDDYREGEVPEPQPDLAMGFAVEGQGRRKRARETTSTEEGESAGPSGAGASSSTRTKVKKPKAKDNASEAAAEVISSGGSSHSGGSGLNTPSSRSEGEGDEDDKTTPRINKSRGRPRMDKGKGKAVAAATARRSSPHITKSQVVEDEDEDLVKV